MAHIPVLLNETIDGLDLKPGEIVVDATYGAGGHAKEISRRFPEVRVISIDRDPEARADITGNFRDLDKLLGDLRPDAILFDIGISSDQLESSGKGFSFQRDEPLDMRMGKEGPTAADILNSFPQESLELIIRGFGEERYSRQIAREIVERRGVKPFKTTFDLVEAVESAIPRFAKATQGKHPATRTFQALRIAVNDELAALEEGLGKGFRALNAGGRMAVISFHSLEDRAVKNFFRDRVKEGKAKAVSKKPITPGEKELEENPRSRSAKLRIIERL